MDSYPTAGAQLNGSTNTGVPNLPARPDSEPRLVATATLDKPTNLNTMLFAAAFVVLFFLLILFLGLWLVNRSAKRSCLLHEQGCAGDLNRCNEKLSACEEMLILAQEKADRAVAEPVVREGFGGKTPREVCERVVSVGPAYENAAAFILRLPGGDSSFLGIHKDDKGVPIAALFEDEREVFMTHSSGDKYKISFGADSDFLVENEGSLAIRGVLEESDDDGALWHVPGFGIGTGVRNASSGHFLGYGEEKGKLIVSDGAADLSGRWLVAQRSMGVVRFSEAF